MAKKFQIIDRVLGYKSKTDKTNTDPRFLTEPSQNVIINDGEKVEIRKGYTVHPSGDTSSESNAIESAYDWETSSGDVINLRGHDEYLQFYVGTVEGTTFNSWQTLKDGWAAVDFCFTTWWDTDEGSGSMGIDLLLFVNGEDKIQDWTGAMTTLKSATANTITKNGDNTWAQDRFLTAGTRQVIINGTTYTYTGGEDTDTLTGVTPDPSSEAADSLVFQAIRENDNEPADGAVNDIISVLNNQVYVGSNINREVYISSNTDFTDFTFSSPRVPGEGALLTLDNIARAFARQEQQMYISAGRSDWYRTKFEQLDVSGILTETLEVEKLKTGVESGARSQDLTAELGDYITFIDFNNQLRLLGRVEDIESPHMPVLSDPIKTDFDDANFTGGHIKPHENRIYIADPNNDYVYISEVKQNDDGTMSRFWQPPQILPVRKFMIDGDGVLYGHSSGADLTYKLFDGYNDNGTSISAKAGYAYRTYGRRDVYKRFDEWLTEGYISANTELIINLKYDFDGYTQNLEKVIKGDDDSILYETSSTGVLGDNPLGDAPLGDQLESSSQQPKFRIINEFPLEDFFEVQVVYYTNEVDAQWEILATGGNVILSTSQPINIKQ